MRPARKHSLRPSVIRHSVMFIQCTICKKAFVRASELQLQNLTQAGDKPYQCVHCHKGFTQAGSLKQHNVAYIGEKPYQFDSLRHTWDTPKLASPNLVRLYLLSMFAVANLYANFQILKLFSCHTSFISGQFLMSY
jgi:hypothetical protein